MSQQCRQLVAALAVGPLLAFPLDGQATRGLPGTLDRKDVEPECTTPSLAAYAERLIAAGAELGRLWPGFWGKDHPFILAAPGGGAVLVAASGAPAGWMEFDTVGATTLYHVCPAPADMAAGSGLMDLAYPVGRGMTAPAVAVQEDLWSTAEFLIHEAFHSFQAGRFTPRSEPEHFDLGVTANSVFVAGYERERDVLAQALVATDVPTQDSLLRVYLELRSSRLSPLPGPIERLETELELWEGTAHLTGYRAAEALGGMNASVRDRVVDDLRAALPAKHPLVPAWRYRTRAYAVGAALALILARRGVGWQPRAEQGVGLHRLIEEVLEGAAPPSDQLRRQQ